MGRRALHDYASLEASRPPATTKREWAERNHVHPDSYRRATGVKGKVSAARSNGDEHAIPLPDDTPHEPTFTETSGGAYASASTTTIRTLDDLLAACKVDLKLWRVDRWEVKTYQGYRADKHKDLNYVDGMATGRLLDKGAIRLVTMYAVKAWLVCREERAVEIAVASAISQLRNEVARHKPARHHYSHANHLLTPDIFDAHMGMIGYRAGQQTLAESAHIFSLAGEALLGRAQQLGMGIEQILIVAGMDGLHVDSLDGTTTKGTRKIMLNNPYDSIVALCQCYTKLILDAVEIAPVIVKAIRGNHDTYSSFWLGIYLEGRFHNHPHVTVDASRDPRKYWRYGDTLIGMGHGDVPGHERLPGLMAIEAEDLWGGARYREFKTGHLHHLRGLFQAVKEDKGVIITTIPSLCETDDYHILHGFVGAHRAAQASFYDRAHGPAGVFPVFVDELPGAVARRNGKARRAA